MKTLLLRAGLSVGIAASFAVATSNRLSSAPAGEDPRGIVCPQVGATPAPVSVPRRLGSVDRLMMSSFGVVFGEGGPDSAIFGTPYRGTWIDGFVTNDKGQTYYMLRGHQAGADQGRQRLLIRQSALDENVMKPLTDEAQSGMDFVFDAKSGAFKYTTIDPKQPRGEITMTGTSFAWKEEGGVDLKGRLFAPVGMQLTFPTRQDGKAGTQTYYHQQYVVEGTIKGVPVKGFVLWEHNYDHVGWLDGTFTTGHGGMSFFGNEFDDGTIEVGALYCGGAHRGAVVANNKGEELINTRIVNLANTVNDEDHLTEAVYSLGDGSQWKFTRNPRASLNVKRPITQLGSGFRASSFGRVTRVGEKRKLVRGWALAEAGRTY